MANKKKKTTAKVAPKKLAPKKKVEAKKTVRPTSKGTAEVVGRLAGITASLLLLAVDAKDAHAWQGVDEAEGAAIQKILATRSFQRARAAAVAVGSGNGWILDTQGGTGFASVYRADNRIVIIETDDANWDDKREDDTPKNLKKVFCDLAFRPTPAKARAIGHIDIKSGVLLLGDVWASYAAKARTLKKVLAAKPTSGKGSSKYIGDDDEGILVSVKPGRYSIKHAMHKLPWAPKAEPYLDLGALYLTRDG